MRVILIVAISWIGILGSLIFLADKHAVKFYYKHAWGQPAVRSVTPSAIWVDTTKKASP